MSKFVLAGPPRTQSRKDLARLRRSPSNSNSMVRSPSYPGPSPHKKKLSFDKESPNDDWFSVDQRNETPPTSGDGQSLVSAAITRSESHNIVEEDEAEVSDLRVTKTHKAKKHTPKPPKSKPPPKLKKSATDSDSQRNLVGADDAFTSDALDTGNPFLSFDEDEEGEDLYDPSNPFQNLGEVHKRNRRVSVNPFGPLQPEEQAVGKPADLDALSSDDSDSEGSEKRHAASYSQDDIRPMKHHMSNIRKMQTVADLSSAYREHSDDIHKPLTPQRPPSHTPFFPRPPPNRPPRVRQIDALEVMKRGTPFLKYGKRGYPHFREVKLVQGNRYIQWFSKKKKLTESQIDLRDIDEIVLGQTTENFSRMKAEKLVNSSFSVIYGNRKKSLDLVAKNPLEFTLWTTGLAKLVVEVRAFQPVEKLNALMVEVDDELVQNGHRRTSSTTSVGSNSDKSQSKSLQKKFTALTEKLNRHRASVKQKEHIFMASSHYYDILQKVEHLGNTLTTCDDMLNDGLFAEVDDELWKAEYELQSLTSIIKSIAQ